MTLTRLREIDPAREWTPEPERADALDATVRQLVHFEPHPPEPYRAGRRWARPRLVAASAFVAAMLGVAAVLPGSPERPGASVASAAEVLRDARASAVAEAGAGPWSFVKTKRWVPRSVVHPGGGTVVVLVPIVSERWAHDDGTQLVRDTRETDLAEPDDRAAYDRAKVLPPDGTVVRRADWGDSEDTVRSTRALPADADALEAWLEREEAAHDVPVVHRATAILTSPLATAEQRAALYTVLARRPEAELVRGLTDPEGHTGDGVRFVDPDGRAGVDDITLLFDRETHALRAIRQISEQRKTHRGTPEGWSVLLESGRIEAAPKPDLEERRGAPGKPPEYVRVR